MKKFLASALAIMLILSLTACGGSQAENGASPTALPSSPAPESSATPGDSPAFSAAPASDEALNEWEPGFYNPDEDYSKNERYKVVYMLFQNGVLYDMFDHAFTEWAQRANCDYSV